MLILMMKVFIRVMYCNCNKYLKCLNFLFSLGLDTNDSIRGEKNLISSIEGIF